MLTRICRCCLSVSLSARTLSDQKLKIFTTCAVFLGLLNMPRWDQRRDSSEICTSETSRMRILTH